MVGDAWSLQVNNQTVTSDPHPRILWHLGYRAAYKYMVEKKEYISPAGFPLINFMALCHLEGHFLLIQVMVLQICFWPLCHWPNDASLGKMG